MDDRTLNFLHFLGLAIFLGNIVVTFVWKLRADQTRDPRTIAFAQRLVIFTDFVFTAVGVVLLVSTGYLLARNFGGVNELFWLRWGHRLFLLTGAIWFLVLIPIQYMQSKLAQSDGFTREVPERYWQLCRLWNAFGALAILLPLTSLYLMTFKPDW